MIKEYGLIILIFGHYFADFILQSREIANNKSKSIKYLYYHVLVYSLFLFYFNMLIFPPEISLKFTIITFICHFITDYFTSKITSKLYTKKRYHSFFCVIGFDQFLHNAQLILCYNYFLT